MYPRIHAPALCPLCGGTVHAEVLRCSRCRTRLEGWFELLPLHRLSGEEVQFLLRFLQHWGNLSRLAREMGVSYPTVRARYRDILRNMGLKTVEEEDGEPGAFAAEVLAALERGEITVEEALRRLSGGG